MMIQMFFNATVKRAFNSWSKCYEEDVIPKLRDRGYSYEELSCHIISSLPKGDNNRVLEIGTGPGILGRLIAEHVHGSLSGIDISGMMTSLAYNTGAYNVVIEASVESLPFQDNYFDFIYSTFVMHSVLNQKKAFLEILRVLKPGGSGILVDLCFSDSTPPIWRNIRGNFHSILNESGSLSQYQSPEKYQFFFRKTGFDMKRLVQLGNKKDYTHYLFEFQKT